MRSDVGLVRSENQDFGALTTPQEERDGHPGGRLLIVADGMGGHRGGATASRLAAETVKAQYLGSETSDIRQALHESLTRANARIYSEAQANPDLRGMGTTTSVLAVRGDHGWLAHVGDSRIYLVRGEEIRQLTDDHSLVASMVREGLLTPREAETHPRRNVLQRSMGVAEDVEIDVLGPLELQVGDTFILCSDGLHGVVKEEELLEVASQPIDDAADELLRRALQRGAPDNVTVIVARVERGTDAPDDLLIERMDDTQPLDPMDFAQFEDTVREPLRAVSLEPVPTEPLSAEPVAAEPLSVAPLSAEPSPAEPVTPVAATPDPTLPRTIEVPVPAAAVPAAVVPAQAPRGILKWTVVLALILGAAGAWFFWSRQQPTVAVPSTSSSR
ncbi:MAG: family protein phosphatase [Acidobacteriota bacterium]|nr:family protein phosphatase [Acidobacteriota bacterium]